MNEEECPVCKNSPYLNPGMKFKVALCGHRFCEACLNRMFYLQQVTICPICNQTIRQAQLSSQTLDDPMMEKEMVIRRQLSKDFNLIEDDFEGNVRAYNDYLEEVEDIVFNLTSRTDLAATQERIARFRQEHTLQIARNRSRLAESERDVAMRIASEKREREQAAQDALRIDLEAERVKQQRKEKVINRIAKGIFFSLDENEDEAGTAPPRPSPPPGAPQLPPAAGSSAMQYQPKAPDTTTFVPALPVVGGRRTQAAEPGRSAEELRTLRDRAGGHDPKIALLRAMQEAFSTLFFAPQAPP
eukprot:gnl/Trimastix_PCT/2678.p1 GENE.gnl/Trimastix_PCT/2678~~gnl/Trimastix_PCT/2678.p1  ORF type:complete len:301 (-),score=89.08 gnl/Trimastix_PCT/2678:175-1077(-)